jgi:cytoskeleton protein RodZ
VHPLRFDHMPALGEEFRSAREARGLTLSDVAEQIHIRSVYLNAIENEDWTAIGAPVYVRGFIRTYARFLALNAEDAVAMFNRYAPVERAVAAVAMASGDDRGGSGPSLWVVIGSLVAVLLVGFVGYEYWQYIQGNTGKEPVAATTAQPGTVASGSPSSTANARASAAPEAAPTPVPHHQLAIHLTQRSWLRVTIDGTTQIEGIFPAGTTRTFHGSVAEVRAGNAGGVVATVDGRPTRPLGKVGDVVEQRYTL